MPVPVRLQLRRTPGFRLAQASRAANGLPAVSVARPGPWGNPFPWTGSWITWAAVAIGYRADQPGRRAAAVALHLHWLTGIVRPGSLATRQPDDDQLVFESCASCSARQQVQRIATVLARHLAGDRGTIPSQPVLDRIRAALAGQNLACWCPPDGPCHADTLLAIAATPPGSPLDPAAFAQCRAWMPMLFEKLEACPRCGESGPSWHYDFQACWCGSRRSGLPTPPEPFQPRKEPS